MGENKENKVERIRACVLYAGMLTCGKCGKATYGEQNEETCLVKECTHTMFPGYKMPCEAIEGWSGSLIHLNGLEGEKGPFFGETGLFE